MGSVTWLLSRLKEPSTWAALASSGVLGFLSIDPSSTLWHAIVGVGTGIATIVAVVLKEKGTADAAS